MILLLTILGPYIKKLENKYKKIEKYWRKIKKILARRIYQNTEEITEDWLRKIKIYKIEKIKNIFSTNEGPIDKEKFNLRRDSNLDIQELNQNFSKFN